MKNFWKIVTSNGLLKLLAFCFACLIYAILNDGNVVVETLPHVPIEFSVPDALCPPEGHFEVSLQLKGPGKVLRRLMNNRVAGRIKLTPDLKTGRHEIALNGADFNLPEVEVVKISPGSIDVSVQRRISRVLPVQAQLSGVPTEGYRIGEVKIWPEKVVVIGSESAVDALQKIKTAEICVKGENSDFGKENVELQIPEKDVKIRPSSVTVNVQIRKRLNRSRIIEKVPVHCLFRFAGIKNKGKPFFAFPEPQTVSIEVTGPERDVAQLTADDLLLFVNLSALSPDFSGELSASVECAPVRDFPEVRIVRSIPAEIKVKYQVSKGFPQRH